MKTRHLGRNNCVSMFFPTVLKRLQISVLKYYEINANCMQFDYDNNRSLYLMDCFVSCSNF